MLLINKTELAADLAVMDRDARHGGWHPFLFADLKSGKGKDILLHWLRHEYLFV